MNNHPTPKRINTIVNLHEQTQGFRNVGLTNKLGSIDPFIVLTEFWMPTAFFPPHPHAGFSVMTYMFPDSEGAFINRDSQGDHSRIEAGAIHLTQAGKGMLHEEIPEVEGQVCHGLQMWLNHSSSDRFAEPKAMHVDSEAVPEVRPNEQVLVRVLLGKYEGVQAAITPLPEAALFDVHLKPHGTFKYRVPAGNIAFVMMREGRTMLFGETPLEKTTAVKFSNDGDYIEISTAEEPASLLLGAGKPFNEPTLFGGPFVMSNNEQMHETKVRYGRGEMGSLEPSPIFKRSR